MKNRILGISLVLSFAIGAACTGSDPGTPDPVQPPPNPDGGGDADSATPSKPALDPKSGSFAPARSKVDELVKQGRKQEIAAPNRFVAFRDPLYVVNAIQELQRATPTTECQASQFGCTNPQTAVSLINEYRLNRNALAGAFKKVLAVQHGWGRVALASTLLAYLNILEQVKGMTPAEATDLLAAAKTFSDAVTTAPINPAAGMYPDVPDNSTLYKFSFGLIRPAPEAPPATVLAANTFIETVLTRLGALAIGPKPEDPIKGLVGRVKQGIIVQGIIVQGIIVQGSEAEQVFDALPYFITLPKAHPVERVDAYFASLDDLLDKQQAGTLAPPDWTTYASKADDLAGAFDAAAGALLAADLRPAPALAGGVKAYPPDLEDDPNVQERVSVETLLRESQRDVYSIAPTMIVRTWPALATNDRRIALDVPTVGADATFSPRTTERVAAELLAEKKTRALEQLHVAWEVASSKTYIDHVDVRIENLTTKKVVFHKVYRQAADKTIAVRTVVPVGKDWFAPGDNDLQIRVVGVDRLGQSTGVTCGSLAMENDTTFGAAPKASSTAGKCNTRVVATDATPLGLEGPFGLNDIVLSKVGGSPYRPGYVIKNGTIRIYNDTATPRRLRSLFTSEYTEFLPIDLAMRKDAPGASVAPIDTGVIAPGAFFDLAYPANTPEGFAFWLTDETNAAAYRLVLQAGKSALDPTKYW